MKIKSEIIYTDTIYYYKKPVPGYICSILSANDPDGKNLNISPVYDHIKDTEPKPSSKKPKNIIIPKKDN